MFGRIKHHVKRSLTSNQRRELRALIDELEGEDTARQNGTQPPNTPMLIEFNSEHRIDQFLQGSIAADQEWRSKLLPRLTTFNIATGRFENIAGRIDQFRLSLFSLSDEVRVEAAKELADLLSTHSSRWKSTALQLHATDAQIQTVISHVSQMREGLDCIIRGDWRAGAQIIREAHAHSTMSQLVEELFEDIDLGGRPRLDVLDRIRIELNTQRESRPDLKPSEWLYRARVELSKRGDSEAVERIEKEERKPRRGSAGKFARQELERYDRKIEKGEGEKSDAKPLLRH